MQIKKRLKLVIDRDTSSSGKVFALVIQFLILLSLVSFCIDTLPDLPVIINKILKITEIIIVLTFTVEYLIRIYVAESKLKFIFSFYGIIDLLAILPFYINNGLDLRSIRILRLFRLFRILKIVRYSRSIKRLNQALLSIKEELILFLIATGILLYISSIGIYYFENDAQPEKFKSFFHCLWWSIITLTTVGYGDVYPVTVGGKIFASIVALIGIGIIAVPTGLVASALTKASRIEKDK